MPVFDWAGMKRASASTPSWTPQEALFAVLLSAAMCDGGFDAVERDVLVAQLHRSCALKTLSGDELEVLNTSVSQRLHGREDAVLEEACQILPPALRLPIFAQALDIILADDDRTQEDSAFLNRLAASLRLAEPNVQRVADIIALKNTV